MGDKYNNELSGGGILLAEWMATHTFQIMWGKDETSPGKVFKDSQSELGKQICSVGTIVEIHAAHDEFNMEVGELMGFSGTLYHFYSVRGSGDLVHNSTAQICGFVVGTFNYSNSLGGTSHAVDIAAVWNLNYPPPNKSEDAAATLEQLLKVIRGVRDGSGPNRTTTN
jgi:hypothetical protein